MVPSALEMLEVAEGNMTEFVVLLGGCEGMCHTPYGAYLTNNFIFDRHTEKQRLLSFLLQLNNPPGDFAPAILPIICGVKFERKLWLLMHVTTKGFAHAFRLFCT
jgi:hypothetical protein